MNFRTVQTGVVLVLVVGLALAGSAGVATAHGGDDGLHHHDGWMGMHGGLGWLGMGWMLVWGLVMVGLPLLALYVLATRSGGGDGTDEDALSVLRTRYARGELDDDEFDRRRQRLEGTEE